MMNSTPNYGFDKHAEIRLCGFDAVDRELHRIEQQTACALAAKADRCALEKHLLECHKCCKSISDCDCYTKDEVDALLANKANVGNLVQYDTELANGVVEKNVDNYYWKDPFGIVGIVIHVHPDDNASITNGMIIGYLPEGFRPRKRTGTASCSHISNQNYASALSINPDGSIDYHGLNLTRPDDRVWGTMSFIASY